MGTSGIGCSNFIFLIPVR